MTGDRRSLEPLDPDGSRHELLIGMIRTAAYSQKRQRRRIKPSMNARQSRSKTRRCLAYRYPSISDRPVSFCPHRNRVGIGYLGDLLGRHTPLPFGCRHQLLEGSVRNGRVLPAHLRVELGGSLQGLAPGVLAGRFEESTHPALARVGHPGAHRIAHGPCCTRPLHAVCSNLGMHLFHSDPLQNSASESGDFLEVKKQWEICRPRSYVRTVRNRWSRWSYREPTPLERSRSSRRLRTRDFSVASGQTRFSRQCRTSVPSADERSCTPKSDRILELEPPTPLKPSVGGSRRRPC